MKKICFLIGNINLTGGTERVSSLIANGLSQKKYDVCILSLFEGEKPVFKLNNDIQLFSLFKQKKSFKLVFMQTIWKIRQFVLQHNIDTLIVVDSISCVFTVPALWGLKTRHICWEHFNFLNNNGSKLRDLGRKFAVKHCDVVVTLTQRDQDTWKANLSTIRSKMMVIANPTPYENVKHQPCQNFKTVVAVGRLRHVKGFDLLLAAWAKVCQRNLDWKLVIVGGGEEAQNLQQMAQNLAIEQRVDFVGSCSDITEYYKKSSIFCLSSRSEGFGMVLLEAQAFALPIVAFDCEMGPAELIHDQVNGFLCAKENPHDLAKKLLKIIDLDQKKYQQFSQQAQLNSQKYKLENIIGHWSEVL